MRFVGAMRMELERYSGKMVPLHFGQPGQVLRCLKVLQPTVPFTTAPVVLPERGQDRVAERQLRLGQISSDKISVFRRELQALQTFARKQQSGAAVHQQPGGLGKRNSRGIT